MGTNASVRRRVYKRKTDYALTWFSCDGVGMTVVVVTPNVSKPKSLPKTRGRVPVLLLVVEASRLKTLSSLSEKRRDAKQK